MIKIPSKICPKCKIDKDYSLYGKNKNYKDGLSSYCRECRSAAQLLIAHSDEYKNYIRPIRKKWVEDNKEKVALCHKISHLWRKYNMSLEQYIELVEEQHGLCAICGLPASTNNVLYVDHDHTINKVRGLLCQHCNSVIGFANDNIEILEQAINYIKKYRE